jgi:Protein of unknown function (DUF1501)
MKPDRYHYCGSPQHGLSRRHFLGGLASAMFWGPALAADNVVMAEAQAAAVRKQGKRVFILYLGGGASQLETWDPKPGRPTGGPFGAIDTSAPGVRISELLPKLAQQMHHMAIVRSVNNAAMGADHDGTGMSIGRRKDPFVNYPTFAEIAAKELARQDTKIPDHVELQMTDVFRYESKVPPSFLGPAVQPVVLTGGKRPENLDRLAELSALDQDERETLRSLVGQRFARERRFPATRGYDQTFQRLRGLMSCDELFDLDRSPAKDLERYGPGNLARHCLLARRLLEAGVAVVKVRHTWWDTHADNFEGHRVLTQDLDHAFSLFLEDLHDRGMLQDTLVVTTSEFGRTPNISSELGRDHWPNAWSVTLAGCGIAGGAVVGATNEDGTAVTDRMVTPADLHQTYYRALGIDPRKTYHVGLRPVYLADETAAPIHELFT